MEQDLNEIFTVPIIDPQIVADHHRYTDEDLGDVERAILASQVYLYNADAWKPNNPLVEQVIVLLVGHFLENRDLMNVDGKNLESLPYSVTGMIDSLRFFREVNYETSES
ncbi:phage gp6-like head-tail connector protein [Aerococcaceae bacterium zg-ZJ1578]|uniref:hypothetical protein n=1 Tax=Aerococcaceae bacterium zg-252 TaxID=2796928 RepID=UPI001A25C572|nr:phage gp6-like head-tail connector protein [Aerococcaceae bacterium zg-1578]MBR7928449.1 phage gp6-like head-tail connector protein [Aerococcaceae bacterium zg-ZUI334]MBS4462850.1 phage gp6-like head-tail connector protein [Aerococcaceae bacterium zg-B36]